MVKPIKKQIPVPKDMCLWEGDVPMLLPGDTVNFVIPAIMQIMVADSVVTTVDNGDGTFTHTLDFTKGQ